MTSNGHIASIHNFLALHPGPQGPTRVPEEASASGCQYLPLADFARMTRFGRSGLRTGVVIGRPDLPGRSAGQRGR